MAIPFFLQVAVIWGVCKVVGQLVKRIGQPRVIGEMIGGVILGDRYSAATPGRDVAGSPGVGAASRPAGFAKEAKLR